MPAREPQVGRVAVVGAGIAGAAVARALSAEGVAVSVIDAAEGVEASGFPLALVTPRLDAGDAAIAGFHAQALGRASDLYRAVPDAVATHGVLQMESLPRDARRFDRIAEQTLWPPHGMARLGADEAAARLGEASPIGGLWMGAALAVRPERLRHAFLSTARRITAQVAGMVREEGVWRLFDTQHGLICEAEAVVLCGGWAGSNLWPDAPVAPVRGQADWAASSSHPRAVAWGGYVVADGQTLLFGATHDRADVGCDTRQGDTARNLQQLASRLPELAQTIHDTALESRAAVRATTPDRMPLAGQIGDGLFVLGGLGSRGFCVAPLLAEHIAAQIAGAPSPMAADHARLVAPLRFVKAEGLRSD